MTTQVFPHQTLHPTLTTWHITFGTYGTRLRGGPRPTVDKEHSGAAPNLSLRRSNAKIPPTEE